MGLSLNLRRTEVSMDIERINRWNRFIDETCAKDISSLSGIYWEAVMIGEDDGWVTTDSDFFLISPSLSDCIEEYIEKNKGEF